MSRADLRDLGEALDEGEAALVVVGEDKLEEALNKELKRAARTSEKKIDADAAELRRELDRAIDEAKASRGMHSN
jgi:predicted phosphoribosyltransferase